MANFTGQAIRDSYDRLLQIDGGTIQDGLGQSVTGTIAGLTITNNLTVNGNFTVSGTVTGIDFSDIAAPANLISSSAQISAFGFTSASSDIAALNTFTSSAVTTASAAMNVLTFTKGDSSTFTVTIDTGSLASVQFANILGKPALVSSSNQIEDFGFVTSSLINNVVSSSTQITQLLPEDTVSSSAQVHSLVGGVIFSSSNQVTFNYTQLPNGTVSSSAQIKAGLPENIISGSVQISDLGFVTSSINIISSSTQIIQNLPEDTVSSSKQIITQVGGVIFSSSNQVTFNYTQLPDGTVSSSAQTIANLPEGTVSSSNQISLSTGSLPAGTVTSSAQISFADISGKPTNFTGSFTELKNLPTLFSSSDQVTFNYTQLPNGTVSSSAQIKAGLPEDTISSSVQISDLGFVTSSINIISSSTQIIQNLPENVISSSTQIVNLIENNYGGNIVTSSTQIYNLGFVSSSTTIFSSSTQIKDNLPNGTVSSSTQTIANVSGALITPTRIHAAGPITASRFVSTDTGTPTLRAANNLILSASNAIQVEGGVLRIPTFANSQTGSLTLLDGDMIYNSTTKNIMYYSASNFQPLDRDFSELEGRPTNLVSGGQQIVDLLVNRDLSLRSITASLAQTSSTIFGTNTSNTHDFTGSVRVSGSIQNDGHIIPKGFGKYDLGNLANPFRDLYISTASIRIISPPPNEGEDGTIEREVNIDNLVTLADSVGLVSHSYQITRLGFVTASDNVFSASNQVSFADISGKPTNFTGSFLELKDLPTLFSSSAQVDIDQITLNDGIVSSSIQIENLGFVTSSVINNVISSSTQIVQNLPTNVISSSTQVVENLPANTVSSSNQIEAFGFITSSVSASFENVRTVNGDHALLMTFASESAGQTDGRAAIAGTNTSLGSLRFNPNRGGTDDTAQLSIGAAGVTGILNVDRIDMNADILISDGVINLLGVGSGGYLKFSNITLPNAAAAAGGLASSGGKLQYATGSSWHELFYTESQINIGQTTGNISGSRVVGDIQASSVDYSNVLSKPTLISSSAQIRDLLPSGTISSSAQVDMDQISLDNGIVSSSLQIENLGFVTSSVINNVISSSTQVIQNLPANTVSSSTQVDYNDIQNKPSIPSAPNNSTITVSAGDGITGGGDFTLNQSSADTINIGLDESYHPEFSSGLTAFGGNLKIKDNYNLEFSASSGTSAIRYRTTDGGNKIAMKFDHDNDVVTFSNRAANGFFNFFANNSTPGASGEQKVAEFKHDTAQFYQDVKADNLVSSSTQIKPLLPSNILSSSTQVGDLSNLTVTQDRVYQASLTFDGLRYIRYTDSTDTGRYAIAFDGPNDTVKYVNRAANGKSEFYANSSTAGVSGEVKILTIESDQAQFHQPVKAELISQSAQVTLMDATGNLSGSRIIGDIQASSVEFANVLNKPTLISSSAQVTLTDTTGNISGSRVVGDIQASSVEFANVLNKPTLISSSGQVDLASATGTAANATQATNVNIGSYQGYNGDAHLPFALSTGTNGELRYDGSLKWHGTKNRLTATNVSATTLTGSLDYNQLENVPTLFSGSQQVEDTLLNNSVDFGTGTVTANEVHVSDRIRHEGDDHTSIIFQPDKVQIYAGNRHNMGFSTTETVVNEDSHDHNFRVESNGNTNMLFVDGGLNRVGIGKGNPASALDINGTVIAHALQGPLTGDVTGNVTGDVTGTSTTASYVDMDNIDFSALTHYDDDTAAAAGGVPVGKLYRNGNFIQVRLT